MFPLLHSPFIIAAYGVWAVTLLGLLTHSLYAWRCARRAWHALEEREAPMTQKIPASQKTP